MKHLFYSGTNMLTSLKFFESWSSLIGDSNAKTLILARVCHLL